jgi:hypothetical protein
VSPPDCGSIGRVSQTTARWIQGPATMTTGTMASHEASQQPVQYQTSAHPVGATFSVATVVATAVVMPDCRMPYVKGA